MRCLAGQKYYADGASRFAVRALLEIRVCRTGNRRLRVHARSNGSLPHSARSLALPSSPLLGAQRTADSEPHAQSPAMGPTALSAVHPSHSLPSDSAGMQFGRSLKIQYSFSDINASGLASVNWRLGNRGLIEKISYSIGNQHRK